MPRRRINIYAPNITPAAFELLNSGFKFCTKDGRWECNRDLNDTQLAGIRAELEAAHGSNFRVEDSRSQATAVKREGASDSGD